MTMFKEIKAKKAAYGFSVGLGVFNVVAVGLFIATALRGAKEGVDFFIDSNSYAGALDLKLYTNEPLVAQRIRDVDALNVPIELQAFLDGGNLFEKELALCYAIGDTPDAPL